MEVATIDREMDLCGSMKLAKTVATLEELICELHKVFSSNEVDIDHVSQLMLSYQSNPSEWRKYAKFDRYRYTRNLVDEGNGKFNLMILCWGEGHASAIHDHADAHCFMKILKGELEETKFAWPEEHDPANHSNGAKSEEANGQIDPVCHNGNENSYRDSEDNVEYKQMDEVGRFRLGLNEICYINDSIGLHRVENPSHVEPAVSLHLYCPPFNSCHVFNQQTGHKSKAKVVFWSKYGQKRCREIQDSREPEED